MRPILVAMGSGLVVLMCLFVGFGLCFAPGWANNWPLLPQKVVWPLGLSGVAFATFMAMAYGIRETICAMYESSYPDWPTDEWKHKEARIAIAVSAAAAAGAFSLFFSQTNALWP
jgi:hypothetical protein